MVKIMAHPSVQYAKIAEMYAEADQHVVRAEAERPTILRALGELAGATVLDLASGAGGYTRLLVERGARSVVGVDASAEMIAVAQHTDSPANRHLRYEQHDIAELPVLGAFDLVVAVFLLNYARSRDELAAFCRVAFANLRSGGRMVGCVPNSELDRSRPLDPRYGMQIDDTVDPVDGQEIAMTLIFTQPVTIRYRHWTFDSYRDALESAGFRDIEFVPQMPSEEAVARRGEEFWTAWRNNPVNFVFSAARD